MDSRTKQQVGREEILSAVAIRVRDDGTGDLGIIVDHASDTDTVDDIVDVVIEARADAELERR